MTSTHIQYVFCPHTIVLHDSHNLHITNCIVAGSLSSTLTGYNANVESTLYSPAPRSVCKRTYDNVWQCEPPYTTRSTSTLCGAPHSARVLVTHTVLPSQLCHHQSLVLGCHSHLRAGWTIV